MINPAQRRLGRMDVAALEERDLHEVALMQLDRYRADGQEWFDRNATFQVGDETVRYMDPQTGIYRPRGWLGALSISTVFRPPGQDRPYEDELFGPEGDGRYKLRGDDPAHHQNQALRYSMRHALPMVWFQGFERGKYCAVWPVYLVNEDLSRHEFQVTVRLPAGFDIDVVDPTSKIEIEYSLRETKQRLHQARFRAVVMEAYDCQCAVCRLAHSPLLDAAHIVPDSESGEPSVRNGLSLCKIHHTAYDGNLIGIRPDLVVQVRSDILAEKDGPMLRHGIQEFHGRNLMAVPARRSAMPDPDFLQIRFDRFLQVGAESQKVSLR